MSQYEKIYKIIGEKLFVGCGSVESEEKENL